MQFYYFAFIAFLSCIYAAPRFPYYPYSFAYGGFPFTGAFSQVGFPFYQPGPWMPFPMPDFSRFPTEWYKGPNVCKDVKVIEEPSEMTQFMNEGGFSPDDFDFNHEQESCRGDRKTYKCIKWIKTPKGSSIEMTKYECCYGYTPTTDGSPGCVEKDGAGSETTEKPKALSRKEQYQYNIFTGNSGSTSSAVAKVPAQ